MPKRLLSVFVAGAALLLAACNNTAPNFSLPTPGPTIAPSTNPNVTQTTVTVVYQGVAQANVTVCESLGSNGGCYSRGAAPITTVLSNYQGQAVFTGLTPGTSYCWEAKINNTVLSNCTSDWQGKNNAGNGNVQIGT